MNNLVAELATELHGDIALAREYAIWILRAASDGGDIGPWLDDILELATTTANADVAHLLRQTAAIHAGRLGDGAAFAALERAGGIESIVDEGGRLDRDTVQRLIAWAADDPTSRSRVFSRIENAERRGSDTSGAIEFLCAGLGVAAVGRGAKRVDAAKSAVSTLARLAANPMYGAGIRERLGHEATKPGKRGVDALVALVMHGVMTGDWVSVDERTGTEPLRGAGGRGLRVGRLQPYLRRQPRDRAWSPRRRMDSRGA